MDIHFQCDKCQMKFKVNAEKAGLVIPCKYCNAEIRVPKFKDKGADSMVVPDTKIRVRCSNCDSKYKVRDKHAGTIIACKNCRAPIPVPQA